MTRFARAKGSKASNEKLPENATPWDEMKKDLKTSQNEAKTKAEREKMNKLRQENYAEFIDGEEKKIGKKWAEFPGVKKTPMKAKQKLNNKKKIKVKKNLITEKDVTDEMIEDFDKSDEEVDEQVENFKKEIEDVLKKNEKNGAPEEKSSKIPPKVVTGKKNKKQEQDKQQTKQPEKQKQKRNLPKIKDDKEHKRRKPDLEDQMSVMVNGVAEKIVRFDGFLILKTDSDRLQELRKNLTKKGVPQSEVKRTIQNERRKAEKYLSRLKKHVCFNCRKSGHVLSECPDLSSKNSSLVDHSGTGICFKCGSTEHKLNECKSKDGQTLKYASCFICREQGHIARECPDNPRGLYPRGGACRLCGDVTHMKKDCPQIQQSQSEKNISLSTISDGNIESLDGDDDGSKKTATKKKSGKKVVKF